ncbi:MAG: bis(5'-nucleosyl)-tetraphosphatase (symmetrical) YqeK [Eubacteriales bacterium]|nr:bis(5'-nucleosyl)-tetraphosphatase (symmetrical) YqeK [Eubacteriales bacterium]
MERVEILGQLRKMLKPDRYLHTLSTEKEALRLAERYGADKEKASLAALLHDCAKNFTPEQQAGYLDQIDEESRLIAPVTHAPLSAIVARERFGVQDEDVLNAIRYHTTGREKMSLLEKIIFVADAIEPRRTYPGVEELRDSAQKSLDETILRSLMNTITYNKGKKIHKASIQAFNDLLKTKGER